MKKMLIYLSIIVVLFAAVFIVNQQSEKTKNAQYADNIYGIDPGKLNPATRNLLSDPNYQDIILPEQIDQKLKNKESFFAYFFSPTCSFCMETTPQIKPLASELNITMNQYNLLEFQEGYGKFNVRYTPTLIFFQDGKEVDRIVGGITKEVGGNTLDTFKTFFTKHQSSAVVNK